MKRCVQCGNCGVDADENYAGVDGQTKIDCPRCGYSCIRNADGSINWPETSTMNVKVVINDLLDKSKQL